ncbi:MAG: hypothetical protein ACR2JE_00840 [Acidobacteriaceae bacterium]
MLFISVSLWITSGLCALAGTNCQHLGGSIQTNFLNPTTTFGTAGGDLKGAIGVTILSLKQNPNGTLTFYNQHHWETETGDTLQIAPAYATGYPSGVAGLYAAIYPNGVELTGGTGRFAGATGKLSAWGAVDTKRNEVVLRYAGTVCFKDSDE